MSRDQEIHLYFSLFLVIRLSLSLYYLPVFDLKKEEIGRVIKDSDFLKSLVLRDLHFTRFDCLFELTQF